MSTQFNISREDYMILNTEPLMHLVAVDALKKYDDLRNTKYMVKGTLVTDHSGRTWAQLRPETKWTLR